MKEDRIDKFRQSLKPIYTDLIARSQTDYKTCKFCAQWGQDFPEERNKGILFYGRANNGWITYSDDVEALFDSDSEDCIFNLPNQMEWMAKDVIDNGTDEGYKLSRSAFIRTLRNIAMHYYGEAWAYKVAYSNLYKVAPFEGGNPNDYLCGEQFDDCIKIFRKELEFLSPRFVIFFAGQNWAYDFVFEMNHKKDIMPSEVISWENYEVKAYTIGDTIFIITEHPQGKKEAPHMEAICKIIDKCSL